ncbi:uncharacterized protein LOC142532060 isoform X1 [Primulina tabacum]|uniref:uncharacterized protein LOC142532060 isoform X1 n=1 Tax=Primulina tabacum TaxID=48773 RepID=UPI003F5A0553
MGGIQNNIARNLKFVFLTCKMLSGNIPGTIMKDGGNIRNRIVNLFRGSSKVNTPGRILPCTKDLLCPRSEDDEMRPDGKRICSGISSSIIYDHTDCNAFLHNKGKSAMNLR